mgnify:CR=1 FL=1
MLMELLTAIGQWLRPYSSDIALALVASALVIGGNDINKLIKKQVGNAHFVIRTLIFILVCTFGYGALTVVLTNVLRTQLGLLSASTLALVILSAFAALGVMAQRKNQI